MWTLPNILTLSRIVALPLLAPALTADSLIVAAVAWSLAFTLYLWRFGPWLMASRLDGKDG